MTVVDLSDHELHLVVWALHTVKSRADENERIEIRKLLKKLGELSKGDADA